MGKQCVEVNKKLLLLLAFTCLLWPAFLNGFPLLFPDSMEYLVMGETIAKKLLNGTGHFFGNRSEFFSLSTLPSRFLFEPWGPVIVSSAITAWTLHVLIRLARPDANRKWALLLILSLTLLTPMSIHTSSIMPDYLAPILILWSYIFGVYNKDLSLSEQVLGGLVLWYAAISHTSHLPILFLLTFLFWARRLQWRITAMLLAVTLLCQVLAHLYLYGKPQVLGPHPPFLLARVLADGPGVDFLQESQGFTIHKYRSQPISSNVNIILWHSDGLFARIEKLNPQDFERIRQEELSFVIHAVKAQPFKQLAASLANFLSQLVSVSRWQCRNDDYIQKSVSFAFRKSSDNFQQSLQAHQRFRFPALKSIHSIAISVSLFLFGWLAMRNRLEWTSQQRNLIYTVFLGLIVNAAVTGILSNPHERYQSRVIWLLPLVLGLLWPEPQQAKMNSALTGR